jgi:outer membrane protein OmpA-like peptidoglycan-associated protein
VLNTQNSGNQTSSANNSTYVPSLPTPRTNSGNANTTTASTTNNSSTVVANNTGSNTANTSATRTNSHTTANNNTNATASTARANNQANTVQTAQNTQARPIAAPSTNQNKPNADVPYVGNAIATVNLAVNFGNDSDKLSVKDKTLLKELAQALNSTELRQAEFAIVGHTNSTGPYLRNLELSCARAIAVRNHLINLGVKGKRLTPYGFGPDRPLANMAAQEVANRRVEISRAK